MENKCKKLHGLEGTNLGLTRSFWIEKKRLFLKVKIPRSIVPIHLITNEELG
jgi:hypothetical protein